MFSNQRYNKEFKQWTFRQKKKKPPYILVIGDNGSGKSAFVAAIAANGMCDRTAAQASLKECNARIDELNRGGFKFTHQRDHLIYCTFRVEKRGYVTKDIDVSRFGLYHKTLNPNPQLFPYGSTLIIDESQGAFDSGGALPPHIKKWAGIRRHGGYTLYMCCPRANGIRVDYRGIATKIIEIADMKHDYDDFRRLIRTTWTYYEFDNCYEVDNYLSDGKNKEKVKGNKKTFTYEGDVFALYDSEEYELAFLAGAEGRDFDSAPTPEKQRTVAAVQRFYETKFNTEKEAET